MGLRALVGVEDADGTFRARPVHYHGCPTLLVPVLTALVHHTCNHDVTAAVDWLLANNWRDLHVRQAGDAAEAEGTPSENSGKPEHGRITKYPAGDREWAYLFCGPWLHAYLALFPESGPAYWKPWAAWPVDALPDVGMPELLDVKRRGYHAQWQASDFRTYMAAVRERFGKEPR